MIEAYISTANSYLKKADVKYIKKDKLDIVINSSNKYQKNMGFGGALTDSSAYLLNMMSAEERDAVIKNIFSKDGLNYSLVRITIGSCDFSTYIYDYLEDGEFSLKHDEEAIIPLLNKFKNYSNIKIFASPWSPPAIFKTNNKRQNGGKLLENCYEKYSSYLAKYLLEMKKNNININYMSLQNEPQAVQIWDSCIYSALEEAKLLKLVHKEISDNCLDTKLFIWDHNRDIIYDRVKETLTPDVSNMAYGIAYHWYDNGCSKELSRVHNEFNDKMLFFTEGCIELLNLDSSNPSSHIGQFENAIRYCRNYILDSENYSNAFIDWNMILDENGSPNYVGNYCEAPIMYNKSTGKISYNPSYYIISHFSKYIENDDIRIETKVLNKQVIATSYIKNDGTIVSVILNDGEEQNINIAIDSIGYELTLPEKSVATTIIKKEMR